MVVPTNLRDNSGSVASRSFEHVKKEENYRVTFIVAWSRPCHREQGKVMFTLSSCEGSIFSGSLTLLVLVRESMAMHSCRF